MNADGVEDFGDAAIAGIASAIGEPARARMLYALMDGYARTSTELAVIADVGPSTASAHLNRLKSARLVGVVAQGKHRYYQLAGREVGAVLEGLNVLAGREAGFAPMTPRRLRTARTCYDHLAGAVGVALHDRLLDLGWLAPVEGGREDDYAVTPEGDFGLAALGIDPAPLRHQRRRFAYACLDWSERRPHLGGALGAAVLKTALGRRWLTQDADSRALSLTDAGRQELTRRFGARL
jgi:DNA-binding transcriptional ArsR family regulator